MSSRDSTMQELRKLYVNTATKSVDTLYEKDVFRITRALQELHHNLPADHVNRQIGDLTFLLAAQKHFVHEGGMKEGVKEFKVSNKNDRLTVTIVMKNGYLKKNQEKITRFVNRVKGSTTPDRVRWVFIEEK